MTNNNHAMIITALESAWENYVEQAEDVLLAVEKTVVDWRVSPKEIYLPNHPLYESFKISDPWENRLITWISEPENYRYPQPHGFDSNGRLVIVRRPVRADLVCYGAGFHDIFTVWSGASKKWTVDRNNESARLGKLYGRCDRCFTDERGRITMTVQLHNLMNEPFFHVRIFEVFNWQDDRILSSDEYIYRRGVSDLHDPAELTEVSPGLFEESSNPNRTVFTYDSKGVLTKVRCSRFGLHYSLNKRDTIKTLSKKIVAVTCREVIRSLKQLNRKQRIKHVAIVYSAEHTHSGLPSGLCISWEKDRIDPFNLEAYSISIEWPPEGRADDRISALLQRLMIVVNRNSAYENDPSPEPYRQILWTICAHLRRRLSWRRWMVCPDFAVFPLDDHGDIDPEEDLLNSVPTLIANAILDRRKHEFPAEPVDI